MLIRMTVKIAAGMNVTKRVYGVTTMTILLLKCYRSVVLA